MVATVVVKRPHPQALGTQQIQIDIGDTAAVACPEPLGLGEQPAILEDHRLAIPGQIGARLALPGGGVDVGRQAASRRRAGQQRAVGGPADGDRAAGKVGQHRRTGQCRLRARRNRHEHVLADLDVQHQPGNVEGVEQQVRTKRHVSPENAGHPAHVVAGRDLTALIELAVGRQVGLHRDTENHTPVNHHRGVVDPMQVSQGCANHQHRQQVGRSRDDVGHRGLNGVEQAVLHQDVVKGVPGQRQLREDRNRDTVVVAGPRDPQHRLGVGGRFGEHRAVRAGGHPHETVGVGGVEVHTPLWQDDGMAEQTTGWQDSDRWPGCPTLSVWTPPNSWRCWPGGGSRR